MPFFTALVLAAAVVPILPGTLPVPPSVAGRWDRVPLTLRETGITDIAIADGLVWIGTDNGLAAYDGDRMFYPTFEEGERTVLIVNDLLPLDGRRVLIGTINGSIWVADVSRIHKLVDLQDRNEFRFARLHDGTIAVANSFGRARAEELKALDAAIPRWKLLPAAIDFLGVHEEWVFLGNRAGAIAIWNSKTPDLPPRPIADLGFPNGSFVHQFYVSRDGTLYLATDAGAFQMVPTPAGPTVDRLIETPSRAVYRDARGGVWIAATDGLHRLHGEHVLWSARDGLGADFTSFVTGDDDGNLWVGDALGLLRYYDYFESVPLLAEPATIVSDGRGGAVAGLINGGAAFVDANGNQTPLDVGPPRDPGGYYPGALVAAGAPGNFWILNHNGLFLFSGGVVVQKGGYPAADVQSAPIRALAVSLKNEVFAGQMWSVAIHQWSAGGWRVVYERESGSGGSAVSDLLFDRDGRLWALSTDRLIVFDGTAWRESEIFDTAPDAKRNLFGAMTFRDDTREVLASGAWGYPVRATFSANRLHATAERPAPGTPFLFNRVVTHPVWGAIAATASGVWRFRGQRWEPFSIGDDRLQGEVKDVAVGNGTSFWVVAGRLWRVTFPNRAPTVSFDKTPTEEIADTSVTLAVRAVGLTGPPELRRFFIRFDPAVPTYGGEMVSQRSEYLLTGLRDGSTYSFTVRAENAFGRGGAELQRRFTVRLPWYRNSLKLALAIAAALLLVGLLLTRRGPMGVLLRVLGGRRWRLARGEPDLQIEIDRPDEETLSFRLQAPRKRTTVVPWVVSTVAEPQLVAVRRETRALAAELPRDEAGYRQLAANIAQTGNDVYALLPDAVKFAFEQTERGAIQLLVDSALLDVPWELWTTDERPAAIEHAIGRLVTSDSLAAADSDTPAALQAVILAPSGAGPALQHAHAEVRAVARAFRSWGAKVRVLDPASGRDAVLDALRHAHFFHYAGHAHFDSERPGASYLPLGSGEPLSAEMLESELGASLPLFLMFVNGCGSGSEASWNRAESVFGLASPFLRRSTYFIGAQWPVQDAFSLELARRFYDALFPPGTSLWWRWVRGRALAGASIGEALRIARSGLIGRPFASPTWPAYVYYGDPSVQLRLE